MKNMSNNGWNFPGEDYPPPESITIAGREVKAGDRVRLHPKARADAFDMMLEGRDARVEIIHQDMENRLYLVVTLDDDPGREQWDERVLPGHRFFFFPDEVEALASNPNEQDSVASGQEGQESRESVMAQEAASVNAGENAENGSKRILIACIGNIFLGDDGFGVEVAQRLLRERRYPDGVQVIDFGIRGMELAYTLLEDYGTLVLVDAVPRGGTPGTLYLIEPDVSGVTPELGIAAGRAGMDAHSMDPVKVLAYAKALGAKPMRILLVGCEPTHVADENDFTDMQMGLSEPVQAAVDDAVKMIDSLVQKLLTTE